MYDLATQKTVLKHLSAKIFGIKLANEKMFTPAIYKIHYRLYTTAVTKKRCCSKMHDQQLVKSLMASIYQSVTQNWSTTVWYLIYKLALICLLTQQQLENVSLRHTQVILLIWRVKRLWGQKCKAYDAINNFLPVTSPNVHRF